MTDVNITVVIESPGAIPPGGDQSKLLSAGSDGKPQWVPVATVTSIANVYTDQQLAALSGSISIVDNHDGTVSISL